MKKPSRMANETVYFHNPKGTIKHKDPRNTKKLRLLLPNIKTPKRSKKSKLRAFLARQSNLR